MDIFDILTMVSGLALFLYGMNTLGEGLSKASGGKLERILEKLTSNPFKAVLLGAGVTAVIQSSSATTVMVVGFVNSGIMRLSQAVGIIMGANIGTTATSWILSLSGIQSDNVFVEFLKPTSFSPILAIIGVALLMFSKKESRQDIGKILIGFAVLMIGMSTMSSAVEPLKDVPQFTHMLTMFSNPILGMLAGLVLTAIIQSSSASVGILQALCTTGTLKYATALPIIMGQNIGTCVTAMLSSVGASKNAKRAALVHLYFNIIGTIIFMVAFYLINAIRPFAFLDDSAQAVGIAIIHSIFNIVATAILLPFGKVLEKLAYMTVREDSEEAQLQDEQGPGAFALLDDRFLEQPSLAMQQCIKVAENMANLAKDALLLSFTLFQEYDKEKADKVIEMEDLVDQYEDRIGAYLVKLSSRNLSEKDSRTLSMLLHSIGDFERISDHAINIGESAQEMQEKQLHFSDKALEELEVYMRALRNIVETSFTAFGEEDVALAETVEPLEEVIDGLNEKLKQRHVKRLRNGKCTIELGFVFSDITINFERIADHCSNIAVSVMEVANNEFDSHEYMDEMKREGNEEFRTRYKEYKKMYKLP